MPKRKPLPRWTGSICINSPESGVCYHAESDDWDDFSRQVVKILNELEPSVIVQRLDVGEDTDGE